MEIFVILERAIFAIKPGQAEEFEKAFALAAPLIRAAKGNIKANMHRGVENPDSFILLVHWDKVDDHMKGGMQTLYRVLDKDETVRSATGTPVSAVANNQHVESH